MHWGCQCTDPNELPYAGLGDEPKGMLPGLGGGVHAFFYLVSGLQCVAEMFHPPRFPQRQRSGNGTGFQRVPVANPLNADVAPVADPFFKPLLTVVGNATGSLICII